jgi:hypothetical protein
VIDAALVFCATQWGLILLMAAECLSGAFTKSPSPKVFNWLLTWDPPYTSLHLLTSTLWDAFSTTFPMRPLGGSIYLSVPQWSINEPLFRSWFDLPALSGETLQNRFVHAAVITSPLLATNIQPLSVCVCVCARRETQRLMEQEHFWLTRFDAADLIASSFVWRAL